MTLVNIIKILHKIKSSFLNLINNSSCSGINSNNKFPEMKLQCKFEYFLIYF